MKKNSKKHILLLSASGVLLICLISIYLSRNALLRSIVDKRTSHIEQTHGLRIHYDNLEMNGLNEIILEGLSVVPEQRDTLLTLTSTRVKLNFWKLLSRKIKIRYVAADGITLAFTKRDSVANYDFLFRKKLEYLTRTSPQTAPQTNYAERINKILNLCYGFMPENGQLNNVCITERKNNNFVSLTLPSFIIKENHFQSVITIQEDSLAQHWIANGELHQHYNSLKATLYSSDSLKVSIPYLTRRYGAKITFDTLSYSLTKEIGSSKQVYLKGKARVNGLDVFHKALSPEIIHLDRGQLCYEMNINGHSFELDSTTIVDFNKLQFHPYLRVEKEKGNWHFTAAVNKSWFPADDLFSSLPKGLFSNLEGIKTSGELAYHFLLDIDFAQLDSLKLESELKEKIGRASCRERV